MTNSGQCRTCGERALAENVYSIAHKRGPAFHRWRDAMARSVGARLLDDEQASA